MFTEQKCHSEELDRVCVSKKKEMKREDGEGGGHGGERTGDQELQDLPVFLHPNSGPDGTGLQLISTETK